MSNRWVHERKGEHYYKKAKEEGYRSRSVFKLKQISSKFKVFEHAMNVLDLGAAPGGWLQVASEEMMEEEGLILGVDLKEIKPIYVDNVATIVGDVRDLEVQQEILDAFKGKVDVIMSDMAPDVMGHWDVDQYRQIHLARIALKLCDKLLKGDGWFIVKIFQGGEHIKYIKEVKDMFKYVKNFKPRASRSKSSERYIIARYLRKDRRLPSEFRPEIVIEEEEDAEPIPGDQLFFEETS